MATKGPSQKYGSFPLHAAAREGDLEFLRQQIEEEHQPVDSRSTDEETPLFSATRYNRKNVVEFLLWKNADVNAVSTKKITPMHIAAFYGFAHFIKLFHSYDAHVDPVDGNDMTPLCYSVKRNSKEATELLLSFAADPNYNNQPLALALITEKLLIDNPKSQPSSKNNLFAIVQSLVAHGAYMPFCRSLQSLDMRKALNAGEEDSWGWMTVAQNYLRHFFPEELTTCILEYDPCYQNFIPYKKIQAQQQKELVKKHAEKQAAGALSESLQKFSLS